MIAGKGVLHQRRLVYLRRMALGTEVIAGRDMSEPLTLAVDEVRLAHHRRIDLLVLEVAVALEALVLLEADPGLVHLVRNHRRMGRIGLPELTLVRQDNRRPRRALGTDVQRAVPAQGAQVHRRGGQSQAKPGQQHAGTHVSDHRTRG